ncbi:MAG TPA: Sec-independent protein translocase protein TatB [Beijerinckiaceae bacterium]|nr:Sec-independent protein translocase protein TatB [Beijerinckiaceae bacterium]
MFDLSWGEVMVIGAVALIVIGPKDLPKALRTVGNMTAKVRRMASEFQNQFQDAMREAELDEIRKQVEEVKSVASLDTSYNPIQTAHDELKAAVESQGAVAVAGPSELLPPPTPEPGVAPVLEPPAEAAVAEAIPGAPESKPDGAKA